MKYKLSLGSPSPGPAALGFSQIPQSCLPMGCSLIRRGPAGDVPSLGRGSEPSLLSYPLPLFLITVQAAGFRTHPGPSGFNISWGGGVEKKRDFLNNSRQRRKRHSVRVTSVAPGFPNPSCFFPPDGESAHLYFTGQQPENSVSRSHSQIAQQPMADASKPLKELLVYLDAASPPHEKMTQDQLPGHSPWVCCGLLVCEEKVWTAFGVLNQSHSSVQAGSGSH